MRRLLALLFACLALAVVVGCGGGDDDDDSGGNGSGGAAAETQDQPAPEAEEPADGGGSGPQVSMKNIKFDPETLKIKAGQTVTWTNDDTVGHDVTGDGFKSGDPGGMDNGATFKHTFEKAGTFDYVCSVHPGMKGSIEVR